VGDEIDIFTRIFLYLVSETGLFLLDLAVIVVRMVAGWQFAASRSLAKTSGLNGNQTSWQFS
jgi:hypothetical protein